MTFPNQTCHKITEIFHQHPDFSVDYPTPLLPAGFHESSLTDPEPAEATVSAHMVTYRL